MNNPVEAGKDKIVEQITGEERHEKAGQTSEPGRPQPEAAEVESARLLANKARGAFRDHGSSDDEIRRLAEPIHRGGPR